MEAVGQSSLRAHGDPRAHSVEVSLHDARGGIVLGEFTAILAGKFPPYSLASWLPILISSRSDMRVKLTGMRVSSCSVSASSESTASGPTGASTLSFWTFTRTAARQHESEGENGPLLHKYARRTSL